MENKNLQEPLLWIIFITYLAITFLGIINHEPWRDEAQSWLLVRDLNFFELLRQMSYEGSPPLWHLIIFPFAKLGFPYITQLSIHYLMAAVMMFLFIFFSPFPRAIKIILPFSYFFLYEYVVVARSYNLTILLLFLIATFYQNRHQKPILHGFLIALLFNTNIHSFFAAAALGAIFLYETIKEKRLDKKHLFALALSAFSALFVVIILWPYSNQPIQGLCFNGFTSLLISLSKGLVACSLLFISFLSEMALFLIVWLFLLLSLIKNKKSLFFFLASGSWLAFIFIFKYSASLRHMGLFLVFFLFSWWIKKNEEKEKNPSKKQWLGWPWLEKLALVSLCLSLFLNLPCSLIKYHFELSQNFSGSKEMAEFLKENDLLEKELVALPSYAGSALLPYLPGKKIYRAERENYGTFMDWTNKFYPGQEDPPYEEIKTIIFKNFPDHSNVLFLANKPWGETDSDLILITQNSTQSLKADEMYYLYKFKD